MTHAHVLPLAFLVFFSTGCDLNFGSSSRLTPTPPQPSPTDPPTVAGRLSFVSGAVSFRPAGSDDWTPAVLNRPVTTGDELWTSAGARAELHIGRAAIRLDEKTDIRILELSDNAFQAGLTEGVAGITVHRLEHGNAFEIDTPNASMTPSDAGEYRIDVNARTNSTSIVVRAGEAEVTNPTRALEVLAGHRVRVPAGRTRTVSAAPQPDAFDQFCRNRDHAEDRSESRKYLPADMIGSYDLDDCGIWLTNPETGSYWTPRCVPPGWAPYRFGRWAWIEPWGWTWIDDMPWGFAPFHYGRWAWLDAGWSWIPGPSRGQPVYAPALVVFVGGAKADVAWLPLGPQEVYVPGYRASVRYLLNVNPMVESASKMDTMVLPRQSYANRLVPGAFTAVSREVFRSGRPIAGLTSSIEPQETAALPVIGSFPTLVPGAESLSAPAARGVVVAKPPVETSSRQVAFRRSPPPAPVPFEMRLPQLEEHPGQPLERGNRQSTRISEQRVAP